MILTRIGAAVATFSALAATIVPVASASTNVISGNGQFSTNTLVSTTTHTTTVDQANWTYTSNAVLTDAGTGGNSSGGNVGGGSSVTTGDVHTTTHILNISGINVAVLY